MGEGGNEAFEAPVKDLNMESKPLQGQQSKDDLQRAIEPQALREEQVQNAVKFLAHTKVRGSPIIYRRSFLEQKGLTKEEIDEAFRRVPDPPSEVGNAVASLQASTGVEKQLKSPVTSNALAPLQHSSQVVAPNNHVQPNKFRWTQMILAVGVLTTVGAGATVLAKNYILPKFKAWLRHFVFEDDQSRLKPTEAGPIKEVVSAVAAAATAAAAASDIAAVTKDVLITQNEDRQYFENVMKALEAQTQELKLTLSSMREAVLSIEKSTHRSIAPNLPVHNPESSGRNANFSYKSLGHMHQLTEDQKLQNGAMPSSISYKPDSNGLVRLSSPPPGVAPSDASAAYMEDVNDKSPNANQSPPNPKLQPHLKPWEKPGESSFLKIPNSTSMKPVVNNENRTPTRKLGNNSEKSAVFVEAVASSSGSDSWWHRKKNEQASPHTNSKWLTASNVTITEMEPNGEATIDGVDKAGGISVAAESRKAWVPPPVPQTLLPGAAAAIRQQKLPVNAYDSKPSATSHLGAVVSQSSTDFENQPTLPLFINESQSDAVREAPDGQELNVIGESVLEKPSYKDVTVEGVS